MKYCLMTDFNNRNNLKTALKKNLKGCKKSADSSLIFMCINLLIHVSLHSAFVMAAAIRSSAGQRHAGLSHGSNYLPHGLPSQPFWRGCCCEYRTIHFSRNFQQPDFAWNAVRAMYIKPGTYWMYGLIHHFRLWFRVYEEKSEWVQQVKVKPSTP